jgi:release factor glutamine methyltransferase
VLTVLEVFNRTESFFGSKGIPNPKFEAQLVMAHALKIDRLQIFMRFDQPLEQAELDAIRDLVRRRGEGEPYAYLVGNQEFWSLEFDVGPGVLIPRPDTETLVEHVLAALPEEQELFLADICAGTGCIGIAIASERPQLKVYAVELSEQAMPFLKSNIAKHGMEKRVAALRGDLLAPIPESRPIDWVVSNPPYIATEEMQGLDVAKSEPQQALDGGDDGLVLYRRLVPAAAQRARVGVAMEIGHDQGQAVSALFTDAGLKDVQVIQDLGTRDRVVMGLKA